MYPSQKEMKRKEKNFTDLPSLMAAIDASAYVVVGFETGEAPYLVPMDFGRAENCIYIHCAQKGRKLELLAKNNLVSLLFVNYGGVYGREKGPGCNLSTKFESVMARGEAIVVNDLEEKKLAFAFMLAKHDAAGLPLPEAMINSTCVIKVKFIEMTGKRNPAS